MITIRQLNEYLSNPELNEMISTIWALLGKHFEQAQTSLPADQAMERRELSFHDHVRLLGYLCHLIQDLPGDIVEIGVWKGKSLSLMNEVCNHQRRIIGIDPFALPNQLAEFSHYRNLIFPNAIILPGYSELCGERFVNLAPKVALLHIDGGHLGWNVLLDFLLYAPSVVPGGFIVFDDYTDARYCPEVGPTVDLLRATGYFKGFNVLGSIHGFENSYVIQRL
ncbi:MAG: cephalosporin hydroxylase [Betaproteobacteria bacterium HGW-Betaproteobacteria-12]|nr:MAG: cephalosporin hydroxylase [Betaproteobacteria bacterium HGW-Betaproteobacteria-12]